MKTSSLTAPDVQLPKKHNFLPTKVMTPLQREPGAKIQLQIV